MATKTTGYPLRDAIATWISNFSNMLKGEIITPETYAPWLAEEVKNAIKQLQDGEWEACPEYPILMRILEEIANYHYALPLPLEHAEMGTLLPSDRWVELLDPHLLARLNKEVEKSQKERLRPPRLL